MKIFIIGFMGSDRTGLGKSIAQEKGYTFYEMDKEIEKKDGRSLKRLCMMMGEHEYRNKEYELLEEYTGLDNIVVACGDGIILDDQCVDLLKQGEIQVVDEPIEQLWARARVDETIPYAFMQDPNEETKKEKFFALYQGRKHLYEQFKEK
ncbi:MAG: shikimate kinase [Anaerovoracaceae bacterium]